MYQDKKIICIIPARGGSKGLPKKNIRPLLGKPLIGWSIEQAHQAKIFDVVMVSTEDNEIATIARDFGAELPYLRPETLARDNSSIIEVIDHAINYYESVKMIFDYTVLLEPTSPLRKKEDIFNAMKLLVDSSEIADSLVSVGEIHMESPFISQVVQKNFVKPLMEEEFENIFQRQQLPKTYFPYGVIYASKTSTLLQQRKFYQPRTIPYFIDRWQNFEIDDYIDFICTQLIMKEYERELQ